VTHTLAGANARTYHHCSIRRASGFVQTRFSSPTATTTEKPTYRYQSVSISALAI
jgi:hypothetical protein